MRENPLRRTIGLRVMQGTGAVGFIWKTTGHQPHAISPPCFQGHASSHAPHLVKSVLKEAVAHPYAEPNSQQQARKEKVEAGQEEGEAL
jgi:hypothetical protein